MRDRAFAELARARGWVGDEALDEALRSGLPVGALLRDRGLLTAAQMASLEEAVDGTAAAAESSGVTLRRAGDHGATLPAAGVGATRAAGSGSCGRTGPSESSGATLPSGEIESGATLRADAFSAPDSGAPAAGDFFGPYKLLRELGRGGMGIVYRALHLELRREVALKILRGAAADDAALERFRREAALVARIGRHRHIVGVHDVGRQGSRLFFSMDFIEGRTLRQRIEAEGALAPREAAAIAADVAGALEAAHRAGVVHRDVKPHNILLDAAGEPYLSDFGLARDAGGAPDLTLSGEILGTPSYMSPEQAEGRGRTAGPATDVYSLGATLYEMLTGHAVFGGSTPVEVLRQVIGSEPVPPGALRPGVHRDLEVICLRALRKEPHARYKGAAAMETDLRLFLQGEPILARPAGLLERLRSRARRHRGVVIAGGLALGASAAIGVTFGFRRAVREDRRREEQRREGEALAAATPRLQQGRHLLRISDAARRTRNDHEALAAAGQAVAELREAVRLLPLDPDTHYELGRALKQHGEPAAARASLEEAVRLRPNHAHAWYELSLLTVEALRAVRGSVRHQILVSRAYRLDAAEFTRATVQSVWIDSGREDPAARSRAARELQELVRSGVGGELHAYGTGMLHFLDQVYGGALAELDRALGINAYFTPALRARAEVLEILGRTAEALADRQSLYDLEPTVENGWALAWMLAERREKARLRIVLEDLWPLDPDGEGATRAAYLMSMAGDAARGIRFIKEALSRSSAETKPESLHRLLLMQYQANRAQDAEATWKLHRDEVPEEARWALDGLIAMFRGDIQECARALRRIPVDSPWRATMCTWGAQVEWLLGNLDLALEWSELRASQPTIADRENWRAQVRLDMGDVAGAIADLEEIRRRYPDLNSNLVLLGGFRLRNHEPVAASEALLAAVGVSDLNEQARAAAERFVMGLEPRVRAAATPADEIALLETLILAIAVVSPQTRGNPAATAAALGAQRGLLYLLQQMTYDAGLWEKSFAAGNQFLAQRRVGCALFRQAETRARQDRFPEALTLLEEALALGFDDGGRLDRSPAFAPLRADRRFLEMRSRCR